MLYTPIRFVLDSVDSAGDVSKTINAPFGANAILTHEFGAVINDFNDSMAETLGDDLIVGYEKTF